MATRYLDYKLAVRIFVFKRDVNFLFSSLPRLICLFERPDDIWHQPSLYYCCTISWKVFDYFPCWWTLLSAISQRQQIWPLTWASVWWQGLIDAVEYCVWALPLPPDNTLSPHQYLNILTVTPARTQTAKTQPTELPGLVHFTNLGVTCSQDVVKFIVFGSVAKQRNCYLTTIWDWWS